MAGKRLLIIIPIVLLLTAAGTYGGYRWYKNWQHEQFLNTPPSAENREVIFRVDQGQTLTAIARNLKKDGLITDVRRFLLLAAAEGLSSSARAGQFRLNANWKPAEILHQLTSTPGIMVKAGVREGLTWWQTAARMQEQGMGSYAGYEAAVHDATLLARYGIPASSAEGYLFPETYLLTPPDTNPEAYMVETMLRQFFDTAHEIWPAGLPPRDVLHKTVILASLVEKETGDPTERDRIAGVFANRLKRGMLIQADPTIIYGLGPDFDGNIKRSDLRDKDNPYNTYAHRGLPPGPICSPGKAALMAAANPEPHSFLYFVAKGDGSHYFSKSLTEHNAAVEKFQLRRNRDTYRSTKQ